MNKQNWTPTKVKDVAKIVSGATPKTGIEENWGGDIPWLTPKDLSDNPAPYTSHGSRFLTEQGFNSCSTHMLPKGTVLLTSRAPVGYVSVAANDICTNQGFKSLVLDDGQIPEFWYYLLSANTETLLNYSGGSTFKELSKRSLEQIEFLIPPIEEQREIVNFMQALDLMIQAGDREIASADQMRGDALKTVLTDRNSQWDQIPLREVATWKSGATPKAGTPEFYHGGTINWAKIGDIQNAPIYDTETKITEAGFEKIKKVAPVGSTLIAMYGASIGRSAFVMNEMATNQAILCGIPDEEIIVPEFLFLSALNLEDEFRRQGRGAAQPNINKTIIGDQKIPLPPLAEQEKIVEKMQTLDAYLESAKRSQEALKQVRKDALHALLSGDKDVRDLAEMFATDEDVA
ncbi:type I restriction enzyme, S subunit [Corynebacterium afermentans]